MTDHRSGNDGTDRVSNSGVDKDAAGKSVAPEWLVDIDGKQALSWIRDHNDQARERLAGSHFDKLRDQIQDVLDSPDRIPFVTKRGDFAYNFWTDANHPRGLWRRMPFADYLAGADSTTDTPTTYALPHNTETQNTANPHTLKPQPKNANTQGTAKTQSRKARHNWQLQPNSTNTQNTADKNSAEPWTNPDDWEVLLDVDALAKQENTSWVWHGAQLLRPDFDRALITLSDGGTDEDTTREFDLTTRSFVPNGFTRAASKGWMSWLDRNTVWLSTDFGPETLSTSGYPLQARLLRRGQAPADALPVLCGGPEDLLTTVGHDSTPGWECSFGQVAHDFYHATYFVIPGTGPGSPSIPTNIHEVSASSAVQPAFAPVQLAEFQDQGLDKNSANTSDLRSVLENDQRIQIAGENLTQSNNEQAASKKAGVPAGNDTDSALSRANVGENGAATGVRFTRLPTTLKPLELPVPTDAELDFWQDWALITLRSDWTDMGLTTGVLVAIGRAELFLTAQQGVWPAREQLHVLFEPDEHTVFQGLTVTSQNLLITVTTDVVTHLLIAVPPSTKAVDASMAAGVEPASPPELNRLKEAGELAGAADAKLNTASPDSGWTVTPLDLAGTSIPSFSTISAGSLDATDSRIWLTVSGFVTPTSLYMADTQRSLHSPGPTNKPAGVGNQPSVSTNDLVTAVGTQAADAPAQTSPDSSSLETRRTDSSADNSGQTSYRLTNVTLVRRAPELFDASLTQVSQHFATSADGTEVPYFQVGSGSPAGPTLLSGYGGFQVSLVPSYSGVIGRALLERGGTFVVANIRGGGEYGPAWHNAALKANRSRAYEDFEAVARDLISRGVTSPSRLAIEGRSNGGLLTGNMLMRTPELFGAVVIGNPLLDMHKFHTLLAGASWMSEYGDPDDPDQWAFIKTFSPVHLFDPARQYPPTLITTSTRDDRVHPWHARALAWEMTQAGCDVTFFENTEGGHAGAADNAQRALMQALTWEFVWQTAGQ